MLPTAHAHGFEFITKYYCRLPDEALDVQGGLFLEKVPPNTPSGLGATTNEEHQVLQAGDTLRNVSPAGNRCHFVLLDEDEGCPTADIRQSQWSGLVDW